MTDKFIDLALNALSNNGLVALAALYLAMKLGEANQWYQSSKDKISHIDTMTQDIATIKTRLDHISVVLDKLESKVNK